MSEEKLEEIQTGAKTKEKEQKAGEEKGKLCGSITYKIPPLYKKQKNPSKDSLDNLFKFHSHFRKASQSVANFVAEICQLSEHHDFGDVLEDMLRDRLVCGINEDNFQRRLSEEMILSFQEDVEISQGMEMAASNSRDIQQANGSAEAGALHQVRELSESATVADTVAESNAAVDIRQEVVLEVQGLPVESAVGVEEKLSPTDSEPISTPKIPDPQIQDSPVILRQLQCDRKAPDRLSYSGMIGIKDEGMQLQQMLYKLLSPDMSVITVFVPDILQLTHGISRSYEELERKLKLISTEKSSLLQQLSKSATELQGMKGNLQSLKTDEAVAKNDVQKLLEISQKQKDEMKSLQESLQKQINEAASKAEKQQAGINFLKTEVERKSKLIKDLQQENKSLKNKLLSGNKQCGIHAEESRRIQSQLKELRYGKKDLIFKAQQLSDLERKLLAAKQELEKTAGDKESQLKALKEVAQLCVSGVLKNQPPFMNINPPRTTENGMQSTKNNSRLPFYQTNRKLLDIPQTENLSLSRKGVSLNEATKTNDRDLMDCSSHNVGKNCSTNQGDNPPPK
ncbi:uncharacterized protein LOC144499289 [Mustelus asterias]